MKNMKKVIMCAALVATGAGLVFVPSALASGNSGENVGGDRKSAPGVAKHAAAQESVFSVRTEAAIEQTLHAYIEVNGNIVNEQLVTVFPEMGGKLVTMRVGLGSSVHKGQLIAQVDPSRPGADYSLSAVFAPIAGTVITTPVAVGSTVSTAQTLLTLSGSDSLEIEALIPEREVGQLRIGLTATLSLEAYPGEAFSATVLRVSPVMDAASRTKKIALKLDKHDARVNAGMFARIKLNTRVYEHVVTIPADALVQSRGITGVYAVIGDRVVLREVVTGVTIDNKLEIKSGLTKGEAVVTQGQQVLTDGARVRVIQAATRGSEA
ncbi:MAG: efflux RND transporter periplasmic adaptor subunit [Treponema sp.]|jgi:multidrug efflux pump subunit AcrA (membrane-fusion protein)|nr:efflux RND transporter periplasmic adaptor subunit [Treponema sp.]